MDAYMCVVVNFVAGQISKEGVKLGLLHWRFCDSRLKLAWFERGRCFLLFLVGFMPAIHSIC
jgi:hypothetical protein